MHLFNHVLNYIYSPHIGDTIEPSRTRLTHVENNQGLYTIYLSVLNAFSEEYLWPSQGGIYIKNIVVFIWKAKVQLIHTSNGSHGGYWVRLKARAWIPLDLP